MLLHCCGKKWWIDRWNSVITGVMWHFDIIWGYILGFRDRGLSLTCHHFVYLTPHSTYMSNALKFEATSTGSLLLRKMLRNWDITQGYSDSLGWDCPLTEVLHYFSSQLPHNPYHTVDTPGYGLWGSMVFKDGPKKWVPKNQENSGKIRKKSVMYFWSMWGHFRCQL